MPAANYSTTYSDYGSSLYCRLYVVIVIPIKKEDSEKIFWEIIKAQGTMRTSVLLQLFAGVMLLKSIELLQG